MIDRRSVLVDLGVHDLPPGVVSDVIEKRDPSTGELLGRVPWATRADADRAIARAHDAFVAWRDVPAPVRGDVVREIGDAFRAQKQALGALVSMETGKPLVEGLGEVQEVIDIADFAVGLSRTLYGRVIPSERPHHKILETWHPLGVVGVITAFNFPVAVWAWNALIAAVCGDAVLWKPSPKAPLTARAAQAIVDAVLARRGFAGVLSTVLPADDDVAATLLVDPRVPLVSATGSTRMGRAVQRIVHERFGKTLLELGGNNAVTVLPDADLELAARAILFGAVGTAGQRCTTTRRVLCHVDVLPRLTEKLVRGARALRIGDALSDAHVGPLVDQAAVAAMQDALARIRAEGGEVIHGGRALVDGRPAGSCFVEPAIVLSRRDMQAVREEVFAPILHVMGVTSLDEAIAINNEVPQGLSSSIFTRSLQSAERFLVGSDCGIANVNVGTSGAEIGGAFGGEKETGGGREAGSDSWKAYVRRATSTINFGDALPLAQGITFDV